MNTITPTSRRRWRGLALGGALGASALAGAGLLGALPAGALPSGTAAEPGQTISVASGASDTVFSLTLASPNNVCPGDTATGNFRWTTYMVPESVDPATLTYNASGPIAPAAGVFTQPLYSSLTGAPQVNKNTAVTTGQIVGTATVNFAVFTPGQIPAGNYRIGYACIKAGQTERYWSSLIAVTTDSAGGPAQITWAQTTPTTTTTTTAPTTTSTTVPGTTTTTVPGTTTTTVPGTTTTTTTLGPGTTTTTVSPTTTTSTTTTLFAVPTTIRPITLPGTVLPQTGSSAWKPIVLWGLAAILVGRIVMLIARPVRLRPPKPR